MFAACSIFKRLLSLNSPIHNFFSITYILLAMEIKVLIVEDNPLTSQDLSEIMTEQGIHVTKITKNKKEALESISQERPDILLVDINLKDGDDGIELVQTLSKSTSFPVVYLTANSDKSTVERALKTKPVSFLTKPYDDRDVVIAIELAFNNHCNDLMDTNIPKIPFVFLKSGTRFEKVKVADIQYLKAEGSYTKFITSNKEYTLSGNLNNISGKIRNSSFLRIHRSYVVNIDNVNGLDNDYVFIGDENIPISRGYKEDVGRILQKIT